MRRIIYCVTLVIAYKIVNILLGKVICTLSYVFISEGFYNLYTEFLRTVFAQNQFTRNDFRFDNHFLFTQ